MVGEKAGIPSVAITATSFLELARLLGVAEGLPDPSTAEYPGTLSSDSEDVIKDKIEKRTFGQIIDGLTTRAKAENVSKGGGRNEGSIISGSVEEIDEYFEGERITDGLPIVYPTEEKVQQFLKYYDMDADKGIAVLPPGNLQATATIIAANGIMAGCRPEHMPILVSAVEAIADPYFNLVNLGTTGAVTPFMIINGPVIKTLGLHTDIGLISRGPNPAIGRALGLIIRNIANFRPGEQYMGTFGYMMPFVIAEDEDYSPWEPFHVSRGFNKNVSTVTVGGTVNWGIYGYPSGNEPEGHLMVLCQEILRSFKLYGPILNGPRQMVTVFLTPSVAEVIARGGYSRKDVEKYLFEHSRLSIEEIGFVLKYAWAVGASETIQSLIDKGTFIPREWGDLAANNKVEALAYRDIIHVGVCGDRFRNKSLVLYAPYVRPVTRQINRL